MVTRWATCPPPPPHPPPAATSLQVSPPVVLITVPSFQPLVSPIPIPCFLLRRGRCQSVSPPSSLAQSEVTVVGSVPPGVRSVAPASAHRLASPRRRRTDPFASGPSGSHHQQPDPPTPASLAARSSRRMASRCLCFWLPPMRRLRLLYRLGRGICTGLRSCSWVRPASPLSPLPDLP
jgi:hypothetical protein